MKTREPAPWAGPEGIEAVILARSTKRRGACVAGIRCDGRGLIRFVSDDADSHGALTEEEMRCASGHVCQPLDVVRVTAARPVNTPHQPENWLAGGDWTYLGTLPQWAALSLCAVHRRGTVFGSTDRRMTESELPGFSLDLIDVCDLTIERERRHKPKVRFLYDGQAYARMSLTDPDYRDAADGERIGRAVLLVSLPDAPYTDGYYYKFVAKIFPLCP